MIFTPELDKKKENKAEQLRRGYLNPTAVDINNRYPLPNTVNFANGQMSTFANNQQQTLPQAQQSNVPNVNLAQQPQQDVLKQGSENVLQSAQQQALKGFQTPTGGLLTQQTNKLLQDPNMGFDFNKYRTNYEDQLRREQANQMTALQQKTGMTSNTAQTLKDLISTQLQGGQDVNKALSEYDLQSNLQSRDNLLKALEQSRGTIQTQQDIYNTNLKGKLDTAGTGLGFSELEQKKASEDKQMAFQEKLKLLDIDSQERFLKLQADIDKGMLVSKQDFDANENLLNRELQKYISAGDWENAQKIQELKNQSELLLQQQQIKAQENLKLIDRDTQEKIINLQGNIDKGLLISKQEYDSVQSSLDRELQKYVSAGDWQNAQKIQDMKNNNDLLMQKQQIEAQEKFKILDINAQEKMIKLQGDIDKGMLLTKQDFDAVQNELEINLQKYIAEGNWENASKIQQMKDQNDLQRQKADQDWATAERQATQSWQTGERLSEQDFSKAMQYLDQQNKIALQSNDINAQKYIAEKQMELQLTMQMQDFTQEEKMFNLNQKAQEAFKAQDFNNAIKIKQMEFEQEFKMLDADHTFQESMTLLKDSMQKNYMQMQQQFDKEKMAIQQSNDLNKAEKIAELDMKQKQFELDWQEKMTNKQMEMQKQQFEKNYLLEEAKLKLQQAGFDQDKLMQQYQALMASGKEEEANELLANSLKATDPELAKKIMNPDPLQWKKNLDMDNKIAQYQWASTHPGTAQFDAQGNFIGLTKDGLNQYNKFVNETMFGQPQDVNGVKLQAIKNGELSTAELSDPESILYKTALNDKGTTNFTGYTFNNNGQTYFSQLNYTGAGGLFKIDNTLYQLVSTNGNVYRVLNPVTGKTTEFTAGESFEDIQIKLGLKQKQNSNPITPPEPNSSDKGPSNKDESGFVQENKGNKNSSGGPSGGGGKANIYV